MGDVQRQQMRHSEEDILNILCIYFLVGKRKKEEGFRSTLSVLLAIFKCAGFSTCP